MLGKLTLFMLAVFTLALAAALLSGPTAATAVFVFGTSLPITFGILMLIQTHARRQAERQFREIVEQAKRDERSANMHGRPPFIQDGHGRKQTGPGAIYGGPPSRGRRFVNPPKETS